ncbi:MAG: hypothetical protein Q8M02_04800 [Candidatus Didemnitutus sp.]|nr:hypothetical protein [Candidatus Didemnitutus sp.]
MAPADLVNRISTGFAELFTRDGELFDLGMDGVNEQTITFRLGFYLQGQFPDLHVDCEYNRYLDKTKGCEMSGVAWMKPDVIVHRRRSAEANLFCLEAKKDYLWEDEKSGYASMRPKLLALTRDDGNYRYPFGLAWHIIPSRDPSHHHAIWFRSGAPFYESSLVGFEAGLLEKLVPTAPKGGTG